MISFEMPDEIRERVDLVRGVARDLMRPAARRFDEREHEIPGRMSDVERQLELPSK